MMCAAMSATAKILVLPLALVVAIVTAACGTEHISVPKQASGGVLYQGAVLFSQRCAGCHTLSYAGTHGSAPNIRTSQGNSGPNFNQRCERPIDRILYAIENGGFSGAYMPQNIVVGQDAVDVAKFVATYAGRQAPIVPGTIKCQTKAIGSLPTNTAGLTAQGSSSGASASSLKLTRTRPANVATVTRRSHAKKHSS